MAVSVVPELKPVCDDLAVLAELDPAGLGDGELTELVVGYLAVRDRLAAIGARFVAAYVARRAWAADGSKSPAIHLARHRGEPVDGVRAELRVGRALARMPRTAQAFAAGQITRGHVDRLVHAAGGGRGEVFAEAEALLVDDARTMSGFAFDQAVRAWVLAADDHLSPRDPHVPDPTRWLERHQGYDGRYRLDVQFDRPGGAEFVEVLDRIERELYRADWARAQQRLGRRPAESELERTHTQRRHDAAVVMARRATATPANGRLPVPLITVILGEDRFRHLCELADGTPITLGEALELSLGGHLERALYTAPTRIEVGERARAFTGATRRAIEIRDRYCTFEAADAGPDSRCHTPADHCDIDHEQRFEHGGRTTQQNGRARCQDHHEGRRQHQPWFPPDRGNTDDHDDPP